MFSASTIENKFKHNRLGWLFFFLILKAVIGLLIIGAYDIHLSPDEAQYWTWSQSLDWGYYSKPPAIAWQIWLTTLVFGNNEFGVRFGAIVISFFLSLAVYHIGQLARLGERVSFWAALCMAFSPLGIFFSFAATTDGGATLFMTLAIAEVARGFHEEKGPNYVGAGLWLLVGGLYKWVIFIFWPITILMALFNPKLRQFSILWGIIISLFAFIPSVYWNATHDWATFQHVGRTIAQTAAKSGNFLDFLFSQIGILSPILFILLVISYFHIKKPTLLYLGLFPFVVLFYLFTAFVKKMQPNWGIFLYPSAMVLIAWVSLEKLRLGRIWLVIGIWFSIIGTVFAIAIPALQRHHLFPKFKIHYRANPFRQSMGWNNIGPLLDQIGYRPNDEFLFADRYQTTSLLGFYGPNVKRTYFFNVNRERKNHFSYCERMEDCEIGKDGFFILFQTVPEAHLEWYEKYYPEKIEPFFESVSFVGNFPLFHAYDEPVKHAIVFRCCNYLGTAPEDPKQY